MLTQQAAGSAIQVAVIDYFAGQRSEMLIAMAVFLVVAATAAWLFIFSRTGFAMALMITVVLSHALQTEQCATAIAGEKARIGVVLSKFKFYRFGAVVLGVLAMAGLMLSGRGWIHGVAAGLLLVVVAQVVIEHFSEQRAHIYFEKLTAA